LQAGVLQHTGKASIEGKVATKQVLLVSPEPNFFEDPEHTFQARGCDVFAVMSGGEAKEFLLERNVDLLICRGVPQGVDVATVCEPQGTAIPVVLISGPDDDLAAVKAYNDRKNVYVVKEPMKGRPLLKLTRKLLDTPQRKFISILVQVRVAGAKPTTIFGKSRDLSEGGLLFETNQGLTVHTQVVVSFLIPGADRMIQADALVIREVEGGGGGSHYGIKFLNIIDEEKQIISEYLASQTSRS
jgi:DNA-binding response OmpR family regulator